MAEDIQIQASLKVDSGDSKKRIDEINQSIAESKKALSQAVYGTKEYAEAQKALNVSTSDLSKAQQTLGGNFDKLKSTLSSSIPGFKGASDGAENLSGKLWALVKNPIGLIITAIALALTYLYKAFTATDEGAQKVQAVLDGIGAVMRELTERASMLANAVIKIFSGNFKGAAEDAAKATDKFGDAMVGAFTRGKEASDLLDEVEDALRVLDIQYVAMNARLAKSKELLTDETASYSDKKKALKESGDDIDKYYKKKAEIDEKDIIAISKKYNIEKQVAAFRAKGIESTAEELDNFLQTLAIKKEGIKEVEDSITRGIQSSSEFSAKQRQQNKTEKMLDRQEKAKQKEEDAKHREDMKAQRERYKEYETKLNALQNETDLSQQKDGYQKEKTLIDNKYKEELENFKQSLKDKKLTKEQYDSLVAALDSNNEAKLKALKEKDNSEKEQKEKDFQKALADLRGKTILDGMTDIRQKEKLQLKFEYEDKLLSAQKQYKDDANKFAEFKQALDNELKAKQDALDEKNLKEDRKKKFDKDIKKEDAILSDPKKPIAEKVAALDLETSILKTALDQRVINEEEYNSKIDDLSKKRGEIDKLEAEQKIAQASEVGNTLGKLADLVGRQTAVGKGLAIAQSTINTWQGVTEALKQKSLLPSPFDVAAKVVNVGAVLASGFNAIKSIAAVNVPGGGGSSGGSSPSAPLAPQRSSTSLDAASIQGVGNAANTGVGKSFVLATDIKDTQERDALLSRSAKLG